MARDQSGSMESRYVQLQRLAMFLLDKLGGSVTISEQEQAEVDFDGMEIVTWRNPATFDFEVRLVRRGHDVVEGEVGVEGRT